MADVGIKGPAQASAPLTYKLADAAEFIPRSIVASFDGTSATSSFYPCLVLKDAGGLEVCRIPTSASVAAGGSAEASWFPGGLAQTTALDWCYYGNAPVSGGFPSGNTYTAYPAQIEGTSNTGIFGLDGSGGIQLNAPGLYLCTGAADFRVTSTTSTTVHLPSNSSGIRFQGTYSPSVYLGNSDAGAFTYSAEANGWFSEPSADCLFNIGAFVPTGASWNVELWQNSGLTLSFGGYSLLFVRFSPTPTFDF